MATYSEEEVHKLLAEQAQRFESDQFEAKTKEVLVEINRRLDQSNNYKATIGKDVRNIITRLDELERQRTEESKQKREVQEKHRQWFQDWWVRVGITFGVAYEILAIGHQLGLTR